VGPNRLPAVPQLQDHYVPDNFSVKGSVVMLMQIHQAFQELWTEDPTLTSARIAKHIAHESVELAIVQEPAGQGHSKSMLFFEQDGTWQDPLHRFLEDVTLLKSLELQLSWNPA